MSDLTSVVLGIDEINECLKRIEEYTSPVVILGLSDVSKAGICEAINERLKRPILLVTYNELQAQKIYKNLKEIAPNVTYIPKKDIVTYAYDAQNMDILYSRIEGLIKLYNNEAGITIVSSETFMQPILTKKNMQSSILKLMVANEYNIEEIKEKLVNLGYVRYDLTQGKGTFSVRGDILDIAISNKKGIRIEFFGDEVDQIRYFNLETQRSIENVNQVKIYPLSEEIDKEPKGTILEYLPENSIIAIDELNKINLRASSILSDNVLAMKDLISKKKEIPYVLKYMNNMDDMLKKAEKFTWVRLESQDIMAKETNTVTIPQEAVKKIDEKFFEITKKDKDEKVRKPRRRSSADFKEAEKVTLSDLKIGDYVVHRTHGIGQYIGINTIKADGITKDYIKLKYNGDDILYIPTNSLDNIRKYIGGGEKAPKVNKLGGKDWENTKNKVKSNLREVARNLIELYAKRQKVKGFAFEKDTPWQKEFEDTFPYEETDDQLRCIEEIKKDMEMEKPMDRLLCGDVGYGKTEVALRATFKAVASRKAGYISYTYNHTCKPTI